MTCNLNNISNFDDCNGLSVGGIQEIALFKFGELYDFRYTDNNDSSITNYRQLSLGVVLKMNRKTTGFREALNRGLSNVFSIELSGTITELSEDRRRALESISEAPLMAIAKDKNGRCWLLGEDAPLKLSAYTAASGSSDTTSEYSITLSGQGRHRLKRIQCADLFCAFSPNDFYLFKSRFVVEDYTTLVTPTCQRFEFQANNSTVEDCLSPFDPTLWQSDPQRYSDDLAALQAIITPLGSISLLEYDAATDNLTIEIDSDTTLFPLMSLNGNQSRASISRFLNLQIVGGANQIGSVITVSDEAGVLYSGPLGAAIVPPSLDVYGTTDDAYINLDLYPNGQTFTVEANGNCGVDLLEVTVTQFIDCSAEVTVSAEYGNQYSFNYTKSESEFAYTATELYFNGITHTILAAYQDWTNDFNVFEAAIMDSLGQNPYIDSSSISVVDGSPIVTISFYSIVTQADLFSFNWEGDQIENDSHTTTVGIFRTLANNDSEINVYSANGSFAGPYGGYPTNVTGLYKTAESPTVQGMTNELPIILNPLPESELFTANITSAQCPDAIINFEASTCANNIDRDIAGAYYRVEIYSIDLGNKIQIDTSRGRLTVAFPFSITPDKVDYISAAIDAQIGGLIKCLGCKFLFFNHKFILEFQVFNPSLELRFIILTNTGHAIPIPSKLNIMEYSVKPVLHPSIQATWDFPNNTGGWEHFTCSVGDEIKRNHTIDLPFLSFTNDVGNTNLFEVYLYINDAFDGAISISFHTAYPLPSNEVDRLTIAAPAFMGALDIQANPQYTDITHIFVSSLGGGAVIKEWTPLTQSNTQIEVSEVSYYRGFWGNGGKISATADSIFEHSATVEIESVSCPLFKPQASFWYNPRRSNINIDATALPIGGSVTIYSGNKVAAHWGTVDVKVGDILDFDGRGEKYIVTAVGINTLVFHCPFQGDTVMNASVAIYAYNSVPNSGSGTEEFTQPLNVLTPTVCFNGATMGKGLRASESQYFDCTENFSPTMTFSAILKSGDNSDGATIFGRIRSASGSGDQILKVLDSLEEMHYSVEDDQGVSDYAYLSADKNQSYIVVISFDEVGGQISLSINGSEKTTPATFGTFSNIANAILFAGHNGLSIANGWNGEMSEFFINGLSSEKDRRVYEGYLAWAHNMQALLIPSHPFKTLRPTVVNVADFLN